VNGATDGGLEILVVEDNETNLLLLVEILRRRGHQVHIATSGRRALDRCEHERFDAILMDLEMPELDGFAAVVRIRALEERTGQRTPIVAVTASATHESRRRALAAGFDAFVPKPIRVDELMSTLASLRTGEGEPGTLSGGPEEIEPVRVIDEDELLAHMDGDVQILQRLAAVFAESSAQDLDALGSAVKRADAKEIRRLSHKLQGALGDLAAPAACAAVEEIGRCAREGEEQSFSEGYERVRIEVGRLRAALEEIVARRCADA